jgi:hypothetical protein
MLDNDYIYTPASTDITVRWRKIYGYVPASEQAFYKKKWTDFKALFNRTLDDSDAIFIDPKVQQIWQKQRKHKV